MISATAHERFNSNGLIWRKWGGKNSIKRTTMASAWRSAVCVCVRRAFTTYCSCACTCVSPKSAKECICYVQCSWAQPHRHSPPPLSWVTNIDVLALPSPSTAINTRGFSSVRCSQSESFTCTFVY